MRHAALTIAAAAALAVPSSPAFAQAAADAPDVRCLMVLQAISRDPKQREQAARGVYYYLGRLAARGPVARIDTMIVAEGKKMPAPQAQAELGRCGAELTQRSSELNAVNQRLQKQFAPPPGAAPVKK